MFIPATQEEMKDLGWDRMDVILVTGDSYIDHPCIGVSVIGHVLLDAGLRVGIIAQPETASDRAIARFGEPVLFWGVTAGSLDSMVANYTAMKKRRKHDDYTPGGINNRRPDRATIVYSNLIRRFFKDTSPIVLGGIEASLRRIAHYDFWSNKVRRSILFDAKADILVYGMGEGTVLELARCLEAGQGIHDIPGICYISKDMPCSGIELPSFDRAAGDKQAFCEMFQLFYENIGMHAEPMFQAHNTRYLVQTPPRAPLTPKELDRVYSMGFERDQHPFYSKEGKVSALETIRFSITSHRGCYGECSFCSIALHQGRTVVSRSEQSILNEARGFTRHHGFKGIISDVGGPTANMYNIECRQKGLNGGCRSRRCLYPTVCEGLRVDHSAQIHLLKSLRELPGIRKVFVASGIRYDMVMADKRHGQRYLKELVRYHVSGQMKIAPEHTEDRVLRYMGKPGKDDLIAFKDLFYRFTRLDAKKQFLTYYLIAAHPGCTLEDMRRLRSFAHTHLKTTPEQVQIFTPLPSTLSCVMYYTETDPSSGKKLFVEKDGAKRLKQKDMVVRS
ncbi:MAG: YgiQ family radical SAM protein [Thermodesulfobacteriota bacterium]|nr:YgiQ family radical SAM protein [Thermodesulfobacteriota bacterium]